MKKSKKLIALLCTVCILATSLVFAFQTKAEKPLETLDPTLEMVTFSHYGMDGTYYTKNGGDSFSKLGYYTSLEEKMFSGYLTFSDGPGSVYFGGGDDNPWRGLAITAGTDGNNLKMAFGDDTYTLSPVTAGCDLVGKEIYLKLTYHVIDKDANGTKDTLQLGVWFNNKLYNNEYFEVSKYRNGERDYTNYLTPYLALCPSGTNASITVRSDVPKADEVLDSKLEQISFNTYGIDNKNYTSDVNGTNVLGDFVIKKFYGGNLAGKVFSADVTFSEKAAYLYFGDKTDPWGGFYFASGQDGVAASSLFFGFGDKTYEFKKSIAGTDLIGKELNLKLSYEVVDFDKDGQNDSLKLGVWFNGKLYNNGYFYLSTYKNGAKDYTNYLGGWCGIVMGTKSSYLNVKSDIIQVLDGTLKKVTFKDYGLTEDTTYVYDPTKEFAKRGAYWESLEDKVFSGDVSFTKEDAFLYFGDKDDHWRGFRFGSGQYADDEDALEFKFGDDTYKLTPEIAGIPLVGAEFNLKISYQVIDTDEDDVKDTLQLGVWFNNRLYNNKYFYLTTYKNGERDYTYYLKGWLLIQPGEPSAAISIASDVPKVLDPTLEEITFADYGVKNDIYTYNASEEFAKRGSYWESLAGKVFSGDVTFSEADAYLYFGDKESHWNGMRFASGQYDDDVDALEFKFGDHTYKMTPEIAGDPIVGEPVNLKLSYQVIDQDKDGNVDTLQLGVWFNDVLYNNKYFYLSTYANGAKDYTYYLSGWLLIQPGTPGASITIVSEEPDVPKILNPELTQISFQDYGISNDVYVYDKDKEFAKRGSYWENLDGKVFSGDVTFTKEGADLYFGDKDNPYRGMRFASGRVAGDKDALEFKFGDGTYTLTQEVAGTELVGKPFNLKLSYEVIDTDEDNEKDTLQFGVWINDKLYGNEYFYLTTYKDGTRDYTYYLTGWIMIQPLEEGASITVASDLVQKIDASMTKITFRDFGMKDGTFGYTGDLSAKGYYNGSLSGKVFTGDITFTEAPSYLFIGGQPNAWYGISIASGQENVPSDSLLVTIGDKSYTLSPAVIGTVLVGKEINLKVSYLETDTDKDGSNDTLQLGIWINGKLYQNKYFYVSTYQHMDANYGERTYKDFLTGHMGLYAATKDAKLKIASDMPEVLDPSLEKVSFTDYGLSNGTYNTVGGFKIGYYNGSLEGKVFSGNVTFSEKRSDLWIGAQEDAWYGFGFLSGYTKDTSLLTMMYNGKTYTLDPKVAGTTLVGKEFNLKLSYQLVDNDGDGKNDTLKLGIWINDRLYNDEYLYIQDYKNCIGPYMAIHTPYEGSAMTISSDIIVASPARGSRSLSSPPTGDALNGVVYVFISMLAVAVIILICVKSKRERRA